jgi:anti-sigma-K factor RskA
MPAPPTGKAYQLWLIHGTAPTSAGVMAAGANSGTALLPAINGADALGVTLEPAGGSLTPTLPTVAGVSFSQ